MYNSKSKKIFVADNGFTAPEATPMNTKLVEYRPPRIAAALLGVAAAIHWLAPLLAPHLYSSIYLGGVLASEGFAIMMWAWWQFQQRKVAICPTQATEHLITDGVYRISRNPMYLGMVLMLIGAAAYFGSLPFYVAAIVYLFILDRVFCRYEEDKLVTAFGHEYDEYRSKVRRWL